jgi:hypothetical protein
VAKDFSLRELRLEIGLIPSQKECLERALTREFPEARLQGEGNSWHEYCSDACEAGYAQAVCLLGNERKAGPARPGGS